MMFTAKTPKDLEAVSKYLLTNFTDGIIVLLKGDLGAGKSTFVKEFAKTMGIKETSSPTFSIMNNYEDKIFHYDIYRTGSDEFFALGLSEEIAKEGFHFVEWADENIENFLNNYGLKYITVTITTKDNTREVEIENE